MPQKFVVTACDTAEKNQRVADLTQLLDDRIRDSIQTLGEGLDAREIFTALVGSIVATAVSGIPDQGSPAKTLAAAATVLDVLSESLHGYAEDFRSQNPETARPMPQDAEIADKGEKWRRFL